MEVDRVLDKNGRLVCRTLGKSALMADFYLAGGTGLALQLGHRRSLDLDFFQRGEGERIQFSRIAGEIKRIFGERRAGLTLRQIDQVVWSIDDVKVTFVAYPFPLIYPLLPGASIAEVLGNISLAEKREIALMKAYALGRRATFRDYIDIYFLLHHQIITLGDIVREAGRKFIINGERMFSAKLFLEQLTYTRDVVDKDISVNLVIGQKDMIPEKIEEFLKVQVRRFIEHETAREGETPL